MKIQHLNLRHLVALAATTLILLSLLSAPAPVLAGGDDARGQGLFIGVNAGFGGSSVAYREPAKSVFEDPTPGGFGALRIGYACSGKLAVSLEGHGFGGTRDRDEDWSVGATVLALTWHPGGKGFFVRGGLGDGSGDFRHPVTDKKLEIRDRFASLFGLGYDWWLNDTMTLGVAVDGFGIDAGGATGLAEDRVSSGGMTLQFNWYL